MDFESQLRVLTHRVISGAGIRQNQLAVLLSTDTDSISKQQISAWLKGQCRLGAVRTDRLITWLGRSGYPVIVPEYKEGK